MRSIIIEYLLLQLMEIVDMYPKNPDQVSPDLYESIW